MPENYFGIAVMFVFAAALSGLFLWLAETLGPKKPNPSKDAPYECGEEPFESPSGRQTVKFYLAGMLFVLFDVELIFFFPWAVLYRRLGLLGFFEMTFFLAVLTLGLIYAWRRGMLEWQ